MAFIVIGFILFIVAGLLLLRASGKQHEAGLPSGRVVYTDTGAWKRIENPLYDALLHLTGKPDYVVEHNGRQIPVEVKSGYAPAVPYEGHLYQLAAYCLLLEKTSAQRPPFGYLHYRNRTLAIDYTPQLEDSLLDLLAEMRLQERQGEADRSHEDPARCGYRSICDQRL